MQKRFWIITVKIKLADEIPYRFNMDYERILNLIAEIEKNHQVNDVVFRGIKVWPLIRLELWKALCHPEMDSLAFRKEQEKPITQRVIYQRACNFIKYLRDFSNNIILHKAQLRKLRRGLRSDVVIVFFARREEYIDIINSKLYNRLSDPIIDLIRRKYTCMKLEISGSEKQIKEFENAQHIASTFVNPKYLSDSLGKLKRLIMRDHIKNFHNIEKIDLLVKKKAFLNYENFRSILLEMLSYRAFFLGVLSYLQPKVVFLSCYYNPVSMALILACRKLSISTVDIQHGKQGKYHGMYTHWTKTPKDGYDLLPDYFWTWGDQTRKDIESWQPNGLRRNIPIVGGNVWLANWVHNRGNHHYNEDKYRYGDIYSLVKKYDKTILYTCQPIQDIFPECLIEAMRKSPDSYLWLIRAHPSQHNILPSFNAHLKQKGIVNFEVSQTTHIFLYNLLKHIHHHVTCWSSVCYEAIYFNVPTTIIHPSGKQLFHDYINHGFFIYADSVNAILNSIRYADGIQGKEERPYIDTDMRKPFIAIENILANRT